MTKTLKFKCKHEECSNSKHEGLGYCSKHYQQFKKHKRTFNATCFDFNEVVDCGDHVELILLDRKMNENGRAKIDKRDLPKVKAVGRWSLHDEGYVFNTYTNTLMHRLIMDAKDDEVDHVDTGIEFKSDNRRSNLRLASNQENQFNKGKQKNNTSGFKGVHYSKDKKKWRANIKNNGKQVHLGYFNTPEEASKAYNEAAKLLHREFQHKSLTSVTPIKVRTKPNGK